MTVAKNKYIVSNKNEIQHDTYALYVQENVIWKLAKEMETKDKIYGTIFGQAIGDALGLGTEFLLKTEVREKYPDGLKEYSHIVFISSNSRYLKIEYVLFIR